MKSQLYLDSHSAAELFFWDPDDAGKGFLWREWVDIFVYYKRPFKYFDFKVV